MQKSDQPSISAANTPAQKSAKETVRTFRVAPGIELTLDGQLSQLLVVGLGIYILAAFTANEWLYLLCVALLSASLLGLILPLLQVLDLAVDVSMPEELEVSQSGELKLRLQKRFIFGLLSALIPTRWLRIRIELSRRSYFGLKNEPVLPPAPLLVQNLVDEIWLMFATPHLKRGIYKIDRIELMSCFPFGLVWWRRTIDKTVDIRGNALRMTVHPHSVATAGNFLFALKAINSTMGVSTANTTALVQSTSVRGVREFKNGDSIRHIHWPSSARLGRLLVREFDNETLPVFDLLLDLNASWLSREQFELAVALIQSLIELGHKLGCVPELYLNPPIESDLIVKGLMFDLPQMPPGIELLSEILARVEPLNLLAIPSERASVSGPQEQKPAGSRGKRPLLAALPSRDSVLKYVPGTGDTIVHPIFLALVPANWHDEENISDNEKYASVSTQLDELSAAVPGQPPARSQRSKAAQSVNLVGASQVIATIHGEVDLIPL